MDEDTARAAIHDWRLEECNVCSRLRGDLAGGWARGLCSRCQHAARKAGTYEQVANRPIKLSSGAFAREDSVTGRKQPFYYPVGTRVKGDDGYVNIKTTNGWRPEHRSVMEDVLGRKLLSTENVHHINGVRDDNRPENLELWITPQPRGQRIPDLIAYIAEFHAGEMRSALLPTSRSAG